MSELEDGIYVYVDISEAYLIRDIEDIDMLPPGTEYVRVENGKIRVHSYHSVWSPDEAWKEGEEGEFMEDVKGELSLVEFEKIVRRDEE